MHRNACEKFLCSLILTALVFSGCGKKSGEPSPAGQALNPAQENTGASTSTDSNTAPVEVKVAFWGSPDEIKIIEDSIAGWQASHPEIKVRLEHTPYSGYVSKILTRIAGGAAPDIIATEVDFFVSFASKDVVVDLDPFIASDAEFKREEFFPQVLDRFTVNGKLLALPRDTAPFACVFYNMDLFDEVGEPYPTDDWTWDDLLAKAQKLTKTGLDGRIERYGFYGWAWQNFIYGNGGRLVDDEKNPTKTVIDAQPAIDGLQFYADLINQYHVMPTPIALSNLGMGVDEMFAGVRLGMFLSCIWETPHLRTFNFRWNVAMFPKNKEGARHFGTGGSGYCILKSSKHPEEAWEVIKALTGEYGQAELAKRGLAQPARISVAEGKDWAADPQLPQNKGMLNEAVKYTVYSPFHFKWREIQNKIITPELDLLFNGEETAAEAVHKIAPQINQELASKD